MVKNEILSDETIEEQGEKDFKDRLYMPVKTVLLDDEEKQALIDKGLLTPMPFDEDFIKIER